MATLGDKAVGDIVKLNVNGTATEFIIVHQGLPSSDYDSSCDGTWLLMKDVYEMRAWDSSTHEYGSSDIHSYLNNTFINLFDDDIKNAIKQVKLPYSTGTYYCTLKTGSNGLSAKVFLPSLIEVTGFTNDFFNAEGAHLANYFPQLSLGGSSTTLVAYLNGVATNWWLRTPQNRVGTVNVAYISESGSFTIANCSTSLGIRPCIILPSTFEASFSSFRGNVSIGGVWKDTVQAYTNIDGVWKNIIGKYQYIGGVWTPKIIYVWNRYTVTGTGLVNGWQWKPDASAMIIPKASDDLTSLTLEYITSSDDSGLVATYDGLKIKALDWGAYASSVRECTMQDLVDGLVSPTYTKIKSGWSESNMLYYSAFVGKYQYITSYQGVKCLVSKMPVSISYYTSPALGEFMGTIKSENPAEYPENGIYDGYWYIRQ